MKWNILDCNDTVLAPLPQLQRHKLRKLALDMLKKDKPMVVHIPIGLVLLGAAIGSFSSPQLANVFLFQGDHWYSSDEMTVRCIFSVGCGLVGAWIGAVLGNSVLQRSLRPYIRKLVA